MRASAHRVVRWLYSRLDSDTPMTRRDAWETLETRVRAYKQRGYIILDDKLFVTPLPWAFRHRFTRVWRCLYVGKRKARSTHLIHQLRQQYHEYEANLVIRIPSVA